MKKNEIVKRLLKDRAARVAAVRRSHRLFFSVYFPHYITYPSAPFHGEMFALTKDQHWPLIAIVAFRGSGKSTLMSLSHILWAIIGMQQMKFVLIVGQTQEQARQLLKNIRMEIESNPLLHSDLGPFREEEDEWRNSSIVLSNFGAKIMAVSVDQSVRGLRHGRHRPDLIVCDDIEDLQSTTTRESRDRTSQWFTGELLPAGDRHTRTIVIGNLLHEDALLRRIKGSIEDGTLQGIYREYPLLNDEGGCLWPGKYPTPEIIEAERRRIGNESAWHREYLLHILSDKERVIQKEWMEFYDELPPNDGNFLYHAIGIDLAISLKDTADYTAMVCAKVYRDDKRLRIYILPNPVNERLSPTEAIERAELLADTLGSSTCIFVEEVGYQGALIDQLDKDGYDVKGFQVKGQDKRARLAAASHMIQSKQVFFPKIGITVLKDQLLNFGVEKFDDLSDACAIVILSVMQERRARLTIDTYSFPYEHDGFARLSGFRPFPPSWR